MEASKSATKAYILGALVVTVSLIIIGVSMSYAYFVNRIEEVNAGNQGASVTSGDLTMNFTTTNYINATSAGLINDSDILNKAPYTEFSITLPTTSKARTSQYNLYLSGINMTKNFKSTDLKWALYKANGGTYEAVGGASGDFSSVVGIPDDAVAGTKYPVNTIPILAGATMNNGETVSYRLFVWLSNRELVSQNDLLEGQFTAKVAFDANTGKPVTE